MKKQILISIFITGLISCASNTKVTTTVVPQPTDFKAGATNICLQVRYSDNKTAKIDVPRHVGYTPGAQQPEIKGSVLKNIDPSLPIAPDVSILKEDKFITVYENVFSHFLIGKIFNNSGEEVVSAFKIVDFSSDKTVRYQVITEKNLDYFFVYYMLTDNNSKIREKKNEFFIKKFDLSGNQIGSEIKFDSEASINKFTDISYSFNQEGKDLILSWSTLIVAYKKNEYVCPELFGCVDTAAAKPKYHHPVINYVMFDDKLNYCLNKISFDDLIVTKSDSYYQSEVPYITKNREKIILTIKYNMLKELTLKNNKIKEINVELNKNIILDKLDVGLSNKIAQDEENNYYLFNTRNSYSNSYSNFYISKLDDNFKIISSKASPSDMKFLSEKDLSSINNKIQIQSNLFVDKDLNSFRLKFENIPIEQQTSPLKPTILKINDALLYVYRNYFTIIKSGETNNLKEKI